MINFKLSRSFILLAIIMSKIQVNLALSCFTGDNNGGASETNCPPDISNPYDACKLKITYSDPSKAFQAFPQHSLSCIRLSADTDPDTGCSNKCTNEGLQSSLSYYYANIFSQFQQLSTSTCQFKSKDGLTTVYCSKKPYGNRPKIARSCYQGSFSAETPLKPTTCDTRIQDYCITNWNIDTMGHVSAIGFCASSDSFRLGDVKTKKNSLIKCIGNNCNNVLICYTGTYYQKTGHSESSEEYNPDRKNTFKPSLCNYDVNQVCQTTVTYNALYGYAFQGKCRAQDQCQNVDVDLTGDSNTVGTYCCTTQYCNSIKSAFQLNIGSNSNRINGGFVYLILGAISFIF